MAMPTKAETGAAKVGGFTTKVRASVTGDSGKSTIFGGYAMYTECHTTKAGSLTAKIKARVSEIFAPATSDKSGATKAGAGATGWMAPGTDAKDALPWVSGRLTIISGVFPECFPPVTHAEGGEHGRAWNS